jgi:MFS family permease
VTFAGDKFDWASWQTAAMVGGSIVLLALAVFAESKAAEPILPLHLFKNRTLVLSVIASIAVGIALFGTSVFLSQYMQLARGKTPTVSGLLTIPMIVGMLVSSTISGQLISRTGRYKRFMVAGASILTVGLVLMGTIHYDTSFLLVGLYMVILGVGVGMLMQNLVLATQNTLDIKEVGSGTATVAFFRTLGGALGVAGLGAVLASHSQSLILSGVQKLGIDPSALGSSGELPDVSTLPGPIKTVVEQAFGDSIADLFLIAAPIALVSLIAVLFLKEVPLGRRSGIEQRLENLAAEEEATTGAALPAPAVLTDGSDEELDVPAHEVVDTVDSIADEKADEKVDAR